MKVRTAIYGTYAGASAIGFVALMVFVLTEVRERYIGSVQTDLQGFARALAALAPPGDLAAFAARLPPADSQRDSSFGVVVLDPSGRRLLNASPAKSTAAAATVSARVAVGDPLRPRGWIEVHRTLGSVENLIRLEQRRLATVAAAIAAVFALAGWFLAARLTRSLEGLAAYARAARPGARLPPLRSRAAEISDLARAFDEMRAKAEGRAYIEHYTQTLTHELKAPLAAIRGAAEILTENPPSGDRERFLANIRSESARIQAMIERLLDLAALEARRFENARARVDLAAVAREAAQGAQGAAASRGVALRIQGLAEAWVAGDAFLLRQAITNLIQNGVEFSPPGGEVAIDLGTDAGQVVLEVRDDGPGIPEFALPRLFDRFYSLPRPATGRKGTGLGLSIVREVALFHGGTASIANRPGGGASARLVLPPAVGG